MAIVIAVVVAIVAVLLVLVFVVVGIYNTLITSRNRYRNAFSQIDVQLKRRNDLIPNLVETAKGYLKHERETLEAVVQARNLNATAVQQAAQAPGERQAMASLNSAESQLSGALGRLFAVFESYPDLKANQNMLALQEELTSTENKIAFARQAYNDSVTSYNNARETFPNVILASMFNFQEANLFVVEEPKERDVPKVAF